MSRSPATGVVRAAAVVWILLLGASSVVVGPFVAVAGVVATIGLFVLSRLDVAWTFSLAVGAYVFTGHASDIGLPIDPARVLLFVGLARLGLRAIVGKATPGARPLPSQQFVLALTLAYVVASALISGTLLDRTRLFFIFDQYGVVPFAIFLLGGQIFPGPEQRRILLKVLLVTSAYLAGTGLLEGLGLGRFTFPSYIHDPAVGIHFGRARGPFVFAVAMGAGVTIGALLAFLPLFPERRAALRGVRAALFAASAVVVVLTLTRGAWVAAAVAVLVALLIIPRYRLAVPAVAAVTAGGVVLLLAASPSIRESVSSRADNQDPVWERENTNAASLRMIQDRPAFGVGWGRYGQFGNTYLRQPDDIPLRGANVPVHNVPLLVATELGLFGLAVWLAAIVTCVVLPLCRRGPPERDAWRAATAGVLALWLVNGFFAPQVGPYTTVVLWTLAAVVAHSRFTGPASLARPGPEPIAATRQADLAHADGG